jgi:hypothetical protein
MSRAYPLWVSTWNNSYSNANAKSMGVKNNTSAQSNIYVGTSASNSYDFLNHTVDVTDNSKEKIFRFYVDNQLLKTATYKKQSKTMHIEDMESKLKERYFQKWKDEEEAKAQAFRNERYAERLRVNGYRD